MGLYIRMALYFLSSGAAALGIAAFDPEAGTITFDLKAVELLLGGLATFAATFFSSRVAKARGGNT